MSWFTLAEAVERGPSRITWKQRIAGGEVTSYVDSLGTRWVWIDEQERSTVLDPRRMIHAFHTLRAEVSALREELRQVRAELEARKTSEPVVSAPAPAPFKIAPPPPATSGKSQEILELMRTIWTGSDRALEREAGLPKAFLAKAKKGQREGPRSVGSWERLERFLRARELSQAIRRAA